MTAAQGAVSTAQLRILVTTDLHMNLIGHDYFANAPLKDRGLAGLATLIDRSRRQAHSAGIPCLLLDNGDSLQGTPLGDWLAKRPVDDTHPLIAAFNHLRYDAVGLGNHDLDFGLKYLSAVAARLDMPVVSTNLSHSDLTLRTGHLIDIPAPDNAPPIKLGILSVLPPQTAVWNRAVLGDHAVIENPKCSVQAATNALRAAGANVVVVLAHMGIGVDENAGRHGTTVQSLAALPGVDVVIAGHTHRRLPAADHLGLSGIDAARGRIGSVPAVMAGHGGSDLGVIDLTLAKTPQGQWHLTDHLCQLQANSDDVPGCPALLAKLHIPHNTVVDRLEQVVAQTDRPLHSYFSLLQPCLITALHARAKQHAIWREMAMMPDQDLPLLTASAVHTSGGRGGPGHYLFIPKGAVRRRHLAGFDPFSNHVWAVRITGAELRARLAHSARKFCALAPDTADQPLLNADVPSFEFDTIWGVSCTYDLTASGPQVCDLTHAGTPVTDDQEFLLGTNQFRAAGGGNFAAISTDRVVLRGGQLCDQDYLAAFDDLANAPEFLTTPWKLRATEPCTAVLETAPQAAAHLDEIAAFDPQPLGLTQQGFLRIRVSL